MRITSITLENFRGVTDRVRVDLAPVTLLFGANSAGKSTILHALRYVRYLLGVWRSPESLNRPLAGAGGFRDLVNGMMQTKEMRIRLDFHGDVTPFVRDYVPNVDLDHLYFPNLSMANPLESLESFWIDLTIGWSHALHREYVRRYEVGMNDEVIGVIESNSDLKQVVLSELNVGHPLLMPLSEELDVAPESRESEFAYFLFAHVAGRPNDAGWKPIPIRVSDGALPYGERELFLELDVQASVGQEDSVTEQNNERIATSVLSSSFVGPRDIAESVLEHLIHLGPLRAVPERGFDYEMVTSEGSWYDGSNAWRLLAKSERAFLDLVNSWLSDSEKLDSGYQVHLRKYRELPEASQIHSALMSGRFGDMDSLAEELQSFPVKSELLILDEETGERLPPANVGVGISQVLPFIVACLHPERHLVSAEQPELHIHPALQVALGDLLIQGASVGNKQFLIETHSEHLVLRILRRIRELGEGELPPGLPEFRKDDVSVIWVESGEIGSYVSRMRVTEDGDFERQWPAGFFDERAEELF